MVRAHALGCWLAAVHKIVILALEAAASHLDITVVSAYTCHALMLMGTVEWFPFLASCFLLLASRLQLAA